MQEAFVADASTHFQELGGVVKAGVAHEVLVDVARGDPRNVTYAVVLRTPVAVP